MGAHDAMSPTRKACNHSTGIIGRYVNIQMKFKPYLKDNDPTISRRASATE